MLAAGLLISVPARAALLGVESNPNVWANVPNMFSSFLTVDYSLQTPTTGLLTASGVTSDYWDPFGPTGPVPPYGNPGNDNPVFNSWDPVSQIGTPGSFNLSVYVTTSGALLSGTVSITAAAGVWDAATWTNQILPAGTLLEGNLTAFGFLGAIPDTNWGAFDFTFNVTGGELADVYGPNAGTLLDTQDFVFDGSFTSNFITHGDGVADTVMPVPEPGSQLLMVFSVLGLGWGAQRRARPRSS
jgi:hypothetical protein